MMPMCWDFPFQSSAGCISWHSCLVFEVSVARANKTIFFFFVQSRQLSKNTSNAHTYAFPQTDFHPSSYAVLVSKLSPGRAEINRFSFPTSLWKFKPEIGPTLKVWMILSQGIIIGLRVSGLMIVACFPFFYSDFFSVCFLIITARLIDRSSASGQVIECVTVRRTQTDGLYART